MRDVFYHNAKHCINITEVPKNTPGYRFIKAT